MKKLTVLIDMDDTIEDLVGAWVKYLNTKYGTSVDPDDINDWNMRNFFPDITPQQLFGVLEDETLWRMVKPKPYAVEYVKKIIDDGHDVFIVTSSYYKTIVQKMDCVLFTYFPYLTWDNVIITSHKQMVKGDVLIDDGIHNHDGGEYFSILMDASHNRKFDAEKHGMLRVKSWPEACEAVCNLGGR